MNTPTHPKKPKKTINNPDIVPYLEKAGISSRRFAELHNLEEHTVSRWIANRCEMPKWVIPSLEMLVHVIAMAERILGRSLRRKWRK